MKKAKFKTVIAPLRFNLLKTISTEDLLQLGHIPMGITIRAFKRKNDKNSQKLRVPLPKDIGVGKDGRSLAAAKTINTSMEAHPISIKKLSPDGLEKLKVFLSTQPLFKDMSFIVTSLITESKATGKWVEWKRMRIKNGTNTRALIINSIDEKPFTKCDWMEIVAVADDMVFDACQFESCSYDLMSPDCKIH
jgi:hypothetical protein